MNAQQAYTRLMEIKDEVPVLILDNDGYQYLPLIVRETYKKEITEIEDILKLFIPRFSKFNNFKPRKDGSFAIRCQYGWDEKFTGVGYFEKSDFMSEEFNLWNKKNA